MGHVLTTIHLPLPVYSALNDGTISSTGGGNEPQPQEAALHSGLYVWTTAIISFALYLAMSLLSICMNILTAIKSNSRYFMDLIIQYFSE
jgi:hypothetical protein